MALSNNRLVPRAEPLATSIEERNESDDHLSALPPRLSRYARLMQPTQLHNFLYRAAHRASSTSVDASEPQNVPPIPRRSLKRLKTPVHLNLAKPNRYAVVNAPRRLGHAQSLPSLTGERSKEDAKAAADSLLEQQLDLAKTIPGNTPPTPNDFQEFSCQHGLSTKEQGPNLKSRTSLRDDTSLSCPTSPSWSADDRLSKFSDLEDDHERPFTDFVAANPARSLRNTGLSLETFGTNLFSRDSVDMTPEPCSRSIHSVQSPRLRLIETEACWLSGDLASSSWLADASDNDDDDQSQVVSLSPTTPEDFECADWSPESSWLDCESEDDSSVELATALRPTKATLIDVLSSSTNSTASSGDFGFELPTTGTASTSRSTSRPPGQRPGRFSGAFTPPISPIEDVASDLERDKLSPPRTPTSSIIEVDSNASDPLSFTPPESPRKARQHDGTCSQDHLDLIPVLEFSVADFPSSMLQLDSPVIALLRRTPAAPLGNVPHLPSSAASRWSEAPSPMPGSPPSSPRPHHLSYLHTIFPHASADVLSTLYAHLLAHIHVVDFRESVLYPILASPPPSSSTAQQLSRQQQQQQQQQQRPTHQAPTKAMAVLGLSGKKQSSSASPIVTPEHQDGLLERVNNLAVKLERCVRRLMVSVGGEARADDELAEMLGQVVRLAEKVAAVVEGGSRDGDEGVGPESITA